jgi:hypothetical protein
MFSELFQGEKEILRGGMRIFQLVIGLSDLWASRASLTAAE